MKLIDMQVKDYLDLLKSDAPAPGGGSVSALAGAQGVGLFMMVADLTLGKEKYADYQTVCCEAKAQAEATIAEGEAEYMRIMSEAYNDEAKADFYSFTRSLDAVKNSINGGNKTIILDKDSPLVQIFYQ